MVSFVRVAILYCAAFAFLSAKGGPLIRIATGDPVPVQDLRWKAFETYLNANLGDDCHIELVSRDPEQALYELANSTNSDFVQGAILPPFRYVVADLWIQQLTLVARMRRGGVISSPTKPTKSSPLPNYRSLVLMGQNATDRWPPTDKSNPIGVSISDYRSTSEYVYPFAYFSDANLLSFVKAIRRTPSLQSDKDAWQIPRLLPEAMTKSANDDYQRQFDEVRNHRAQVPILSVSDHRFSSFVPSEEAQKKSYMELFRSAPIPFDAVVLRGGGAVSPEIIDSIRRAFLSTAVMTQQKRDECFGWKEKNSPLPPAGSPPAATSKYWQREPDIHDFVEARDEDYDDVRRAGAKAFHGRVVHVAASSRVHREEDKDFEYFRLWMKHVLRQTVAKEPVFIDVEQRDSDFDLILRELEDGRLHAAELNAATAARAIGRKTCALIGKAIFNGSDNYSFVMLAAKGLPVDPDKIDDSLKFAYTSEDSSSGYQYPFTLLKKLGINPSKNSRIKGSNAEGVVDRLVNRTQNKQPFADYGFLADFEWDGIQKRWTDPELKNINKIKLEPELVEIPNAYLVFSRATAPDIDLLGLPAPRERPSSWVEHESIPQPLNSSIVELVRTNLLPISTPGFQGYKRPAQADVDSLMGFYDRFGNDPVRAGVILLVTLVLLLAAGMVLSLKRRDFGPQAPFSIQALSDVLKGFPVENRIAQKTVALAMKQIAALRRERVGLTQIFEKPPLELQTDLEARLLELLSFHHAKRRTVGDGTYFTALGHLQRAIVATDEQFRKVPAGFSALDEPTREGFDLAAIKTLIEIGKTVIDFLK
jgi:ABC-type phosphate/phosphonate transport system substrate-binding protein